MLRTLRDDQSEAIEELRWALLGKDKGGEGERRIVLKAPTGFGKTVVAGAIIERALELNKRVLFTVPALSLIDQAVESFQYEGINDIGVIQADHEMTDWKKPVHVASIQTLSRRPVSDAALQRMVEERESAPNDRRRALPKAPIPKADVVLVDECHRWFKFYGDWFLDPAWQNVPIIGLSATPWTKGLGSYYGKLIIGGTTKALIDAGHLCPFRVFAPSHPDLKGVRTVAGDYHEGDLSQRMSDSGLTADIVATWLKLGERRPTFLFAVDRAHAKALQAKFEAVGVKTGYIDAFTKREEREAIRKAFHNGDIEIVCNVGVLTTGIDWDVRCLILARPTKSHMLFVQIVGRGLRNANGKDYCLVLDHSDNHLRLGFVTDIDAAHTTLNDGLTQEKEKADSIPLPKECPKCHYLKPPRMGQCPCCGFKPEPVSNVTPQAGELQELEPQAKGAPAAKGFPDRSSTYLMLRGYAASQGFKQGWAANKFRDLYGVWPRNIPDDVRAIEGKILNHRPIEMQPAQCWPTSALLSWIKSQQIRWAHSKRNHRRPQQSLAV
jgi:DNA repair protein RadD